ncbi:MAG: ribose 5-phosphate isomerase B [Bacteroidales bacterium]|nr:ribose 5-phosphate isomerase B [Candidatus Cacconaster scatequi]
MIIGIASDHAGAAYKAEISLYLVKRGYDVVDFGTYEGMESVDYPDYANALADGISKGVVEKGIALCGTGNGMAITLNHWSGIRAGLAWNKETARLVKAHNDANVLALPARFISLTMAKACVKTWLETRFDGGRHQRRIDKIR